jgi:hypothetical protein
VDNSAIFDRQTFEVSTGQPLLGLALIVIFEMADRARRMEAFKSMRKDQASVERLAAATRNAKAALKGGPVAMGGTSGANKRNKENVSGLGDSVSDRSGTGYSSPSRSGGSGGPFGMLDANAYR